MHCGSTNARAKTFAKYSAIVCLIQFFAIVALIVLEVVVLTNAILPLTQCSSDCLLCLDRTDCQMNGMNCYWDQRIDNCMSNSTAL